MSRRDVHVVGTPCQPYSCQSGSSARVRVPESRAGAGSSAKTGMPPMSRRDVHLVGTPCQPYSRQSGSAAGCRVHDLYHVTFSWTTGLLGYLKFNMPKVLVLEQLQAFGERDQAEHFVPMREFLKLVMSIKDEHNDNQNYYVSCKVFPENPHNWMNMNRPRFPSVSKFHVFHYGRWLC